MIEKRNVLKERDDDSEDDSETTFDQSHEKGDDGCVGIYFSRWSRTSLGTGEVVVKLMPVNHAKWDCTSFSSSTDKSFVRICFLCKAANEAERRKGKG